MRKSTLRSYLKKREEGPGKDYPTPLSFRKSALSYGIAKGKLGHKGKGTAPVKVKATEETQVAKTFTEFMTEGFGEGKGHPDGQQDRHGHGAHEGYKTSSYVGRSEQSERRREGHLSIHVYHGDRKHIGTVYHYNDGHVRSDSNTEGSSYGSRYVSHGSLPKHPSVEHAVNHLIAQHKAKKPEPEHKSSGNGKPASGSNHGPAYHSFKHAQAHSLNGFGGHPDNYKGRGY